MATIANLTGYKDQAGASAPAKHEVIEVTYDFAVQGGAVGQYPIMIADGAHVVKLAGLKVDTACTSGGSATVGVGKTADLAGVIAATAVASLTAGAYIPNAAIDASHKLADNDVLYLDIATAALTAGKIRVYLEVLKF